MPRTTLHDRVEGVIGARMFKLVRYIISGGTAAMTNWIVLFLLVHFGQMYYLSASVIAFVLSIAVSFVMQKFWTFQDRLVSDVHAQFARYSVVIFSNLVLNTALVYLLVEKAGVWYLMAQILGTVVIAITGYFGYKHFVFRDRPPQPTI